ncbi:hypothetical protein C0991_004546 [Blastosporella zonata]|nr:hypothetical protein C0991_004546 [Blastosporella zonata]
MSISICSELIAPAGAAQAIKQHSQRIIELLEAGGYNGPLLIQFCLDTDNIGTTSLLDLPECVCFHLRTNARVDEKTRSDINSLFSPSQITTKFEFDLPVEAMSMIIPKDGQGDEEDGGGLFAPAPVFWVGPRRT